MNVIGLTGFAESGKSTVANYLVEAHGFTRLSFAGPLKNMLRTLDPFLSSAFDDQCYRLSEVDQNHPEAELKALFPEYRRLLQVLGTDCIRAHDPHFWVNAATEQMTDWDNGKYVFDDVRFPNEAEIIKDLNSWGLWEVVRPELKPAADAHASEQFAGKLGEYQIINNGADMGYLNKQVDKALTVFLETSEAAA